MGSGAVTEVEFSLTDPGHPLVRATTAVDCRLVLEEVLPDASGSAQLFVSVHDAPASRVVDALEGTPGVDPLLVADLRDGGVVRLRMLERCPLVTLASAGAVLKTLVAAGGEARIVAEVLPGVEADAVRDRVRTDHDDVEVVAKRERAVASPTFLGRQLEEAARERLTDRQLEVLTAAYIAGYYEMPREVTGGELAERLDIAPSTFAKHLRAAEQTVVMLVFGELDHHPDW